MSKFEIELSEEQYEEFQKKIRKFLATKEENARWGIIGFPDKAKKAMQFFFLSAKEHEKLENCFDEIINAREEDKP
jgi:hypothetical protein